MDAARRAVSSEALRPRALYNIACARALQGHQDEALIALEEAVQAGLKYPRPVVEEEDDLQSLRGEGRFQTLLARL